MNSLSHCLFHSLSLSLSFSLSLSLHLSISFTLTVSRSLPPPVTPCLFPSDPFSLYLCLCQSLPAFLNISHKSRFVLFILNNALPNLTFTVFIPFNALCYHYNKTTIIAHETKSPKGNIQPNAKGESLERTLADKLALLEKK